MDLARHAAERVAAWDERRRREFARLLTLIDSRVTALLTLARPRRFSDRPADDRVRWLAGWERSRLPVRRTIFQALRRAILSTYYALPESWEAIGYRGPYHLRGLAVDWEGPIVGILDDPGPVAVEPKRERHEGDPRHDVGTAPASPTGSVVRAEVCVIGTGAGGAVAAARLAEAGKEVVLLEAGGYRSSETFDEDEAVQVPRLYAEQANRSTDDLAIPIFQGECVGGGTTVNWMITLRTPDAVLEEWAAEQGMEGMTAAAMQPVFERIEDEIHARVVPEAAHSPNNRIILDGARNLGWAARAARINARDCLRTGHCGLGCRYAAKRSALVTYVPRAVRAGARLYPDARVERVERRNGAWRVHVAPQPGSRGAAAWAVDAGTVVLAAGAVGSPVVLQRSGLGGPAVGRYLRLHPTTAVGGVFEREIYAASGIPQSAYCDHFLREHDGYGFWLEGAPLQPALAAIALQGFGGPHREYMLRFRHLGILIALVRDGADRRRSNGRIWAGRTGRVHIRYRLGPAERRTMREAIEAGLRMLFAAGAREAHSLHLGMPSIRSPDQIPDVVERPGGPNRIAVFSAHVNGTCRAGTDPATSVCTPDAQVRGAPGIYVCDGSLMPTAPGVNPQLTIMAMASVIVGRIAP